MKSAAVLAMCLVGLVGVSLGDVVMREVKTVQIHGVPGHKPPMRQVGFAAVSSVGWRGGAIFFSDFIV